MSSSRAVVTRPRLRLPAGETGPFRRRFRAPFHSGRDGRQRKFHPGSPNSPPVTRQPAEPDSDPRSAAHTARPEVQRAVDESTIPQTRCRRATPHPLSVHAQRRRLVRPAVRQRRMKAPNGFGHHETPASQGCSLASMCCQQSPTTCRAATTGVRKSSVQSTSSSRQ